MRIGSSLLALASAAFLLVSVSTADAQEVPRPLLGTCCSCQAQVKQLKNLDLLKIGARIDPSPTAIIDPVLTGMTIELSNANGTIITAAIPPGAFVSNGAGTKFTFKDKAARTTGGVFSATIQEKFDGDGGFILSIKIYGDLSAATLPDMTTSIVIGTSPFFNTSMWDPRNNGWRKKFPN